MTAAILNGKALSEQIRAEIAGEVALFVAKTGVMPCLAAVLVGEDPGSQVYVRNKQKACEKAGIASQLHRPPAETTTEELLALIDRLNRDPAVHGILVQSPPPKQIDERRVLSAINPLKDVRRLPSRERRPDRSGPAAVSSLHAPRSSTTAVAQRHPDRRRQRGGGGP